MNYVGKLREFHTKYGHYMSAVPTLPPADVRYLRAKLIREECEETVEAIETNNVVLVADGIADSLYVLFGTAISFGIPIDEVFAEVHRSNMSKSTEKNLYGKTIKGKDFVPPDILGVLSRFSGV